MHPNVAASPPSTGPMHPAGPVSDWLLRWAHLLRPGSRALDLACGSGRHLHWLVQQGHAATGIDRDAAALAQGPAAAERLQADLESGPWPLASRQFDAVLVFNYLWRDRLDALLACLAPEGVLLYETFGLAHARIGRPSRPDFLLRPGELFARCSAAGLQVVAYEEGLKAGPDRFVQRIAARRASSEATEAPSWPLLPG